MHVAHSTALRARPVAPAGRNRPPATLPYLVSAGTNLFREGDRCVGLFEVVAGVLRLSRLTRGGRRYVIGFGFPGDILGHGPDDAHISDCEAVSDARVIRHRPGTLHDRDAGPQLHQALVRGALRQVQAMQDHCMMLGRNNAVDRVAAFLSLLGERLGVRSGQSVAFDLPMPRTDIADYLGLTNETVSRSLTELRRTGLIAITNVHHVVLLRPQCIDALAEGEAA